MTETKKFAVQRHTYGNLILEYQIEYGSAARKNRGRFSGAKIHKLICSYVVGIVDQNIVPHKSFEEKFLQTNRPVLFSCHPACGCTLGQHAGKPFANLTADQVTCSKCK